MPGWSRWAGGAVSLGLILAGIGATLPAGPLRAGAPAGPDQSPETAAASGDDGAHSTAAKAGAVLEAYCAGCHQAGRLEGFAPDRFGNILDLDELAREPALVVPRSPDASRLYQRMLGRHAPLEVFGLAAGARGPRPDEIDAIRQWIEKLEPRAARCDGRRLVSSEETEAAQRRWLEQAGSAAQETRFVSLTHLYNACAGAADIAGYRQGVQKLLNSLSWRPEPVRIDTVGDSSTLLAFKLGDAGWRPEQWQALAEAASRTGAEPVPGDGLAAAALGAPRYYELLGIPADIKGLGERLGVDLAASSAPATAKRGLVRKSAVTGGARLVEIHEKGGRRVWLARDFPPGKDADAIAENPAGSGAPALTRVLFGLPNGSMAWALYDGSGSRIDRIDTSLRPEPAAGTSATGAGLGCFGCHADGARPITDAKGAQAKGGTADPEHAAPAGFPGNEELARIAAGDSAGYRKAQTGAGIDPDLRVSGLEIMAALARQWRLEVGLERAAAEAGLEPPAFADRLRAYRGEEQALARRLMLGLLPRAAWERLRLALHPAREAAPSPPPAATGEQDSTIDLGLWSDSAAFKAGDLVTLSARASMSCHLTLVSVGGDGRAVVLFPNDLEPDNLIAAGQTVRIPNDGAGYQLRFDKPGSETVVGICQRAAVRPEGIGFDFERQRFTILGDWREFLETAAEREAEIRGRTSRRSRRKARPESAAIDPGGPRIEGRAAITLKVE